MGGGVLMKLLRFAFLSLLCVLIGEQLARAQGNSGSILGDVTDASGARLPGVSVRLLNQASGATREAVTTDVGSYRFDGLPPVEYTVTAELPGFTTVTRQNIKVDIASQLKLDFQLKVASTSETVTV